MASDQHRIHANLSTDADNVNNEGIMHNKPKSQSITGAGSVSSAMGSRRFQFYAECDEGINLVVDLNSSPSDFFELGLPQNLHKQIKRPYVEKGVNLPPATTQGVDEFCGSTKGHESLCTNSSKSRCLPQPSRAMEELSVQSGAWENGAMCEKQQPGKEGIDQSSLTCMPAKEIEPRNVEMGDQVAPGFCQQVAGNELVVQNQGREIQRSLGVHYAMEGTRNEMQCTHQNIEHSQVESRRCILKYKDGDNKTPIVKNLRFLKTLARGPLVQTSAVERRRSTRLVDKSP